MQSLKKFYFGKQKSRPFIIKVNVTSTFTIPTTGTGYNYRVKTSDGQTLSGRTGNTTITFPSAGIYTIEISGSFPQIYFNNTGDRLLVIDILQWGTQIWRSFLSAFFGCSNLKMSATDIPMLASNCSFRNMFVNCTNFGLTTDITNINNWDTTNVTNMESMFQQAAGFNQPIWKWNTSNVTNMSLMFYLTTSFNQYIGSWDTKNVTSMSGLFYSATNFNNGLASGVSGSMPWNFSKVTNMSNMFQSATAFNQDISNWNVSNVNNMASMFYNKANFNQDISNWNVSNVNNMSFMFANTNFNQNIGSWNVSNVTNFTNFMLGKTSANFSTSNLDAIYNGWSSRPVKTPITITFGTAKYTAAGAAGRAILTGAPNNWAITDGGI